MMLKIQIWNITGINYIFNFNISQYDSFYCVFDQICPYFKMIKVAVFWQIYSSHTFLRLLKCFHLQFTLINTLGDSFNYFLKVVQAKVLRCDPENKKLCLSFKAVTEGDIKVEQTEKFDFVVGKVIWPKQLFILIFANHRKIKKKYMTLHVISYLGSQCKSLPQSPGWFGSLHCSWRGSSFHTHSASLWSCDQLLSPVDGVGGGWHHL